MKRNNIFMFAYIVFIFLCVWIKAIWDFPMWNRIVVAITAASWLFAISDCFHSLSNILSEMYNTLFSLIDTSNFRLLQIKAHIDKYGKQLEDVEFESLERCIKRSNSMLKTMSKIQKCSGFFKNATVLVTFLAFLLFLCTLCFESIYRPFFVGQDGFTVLSFGMILLAQFGSNIAHDYISKMKNDYSLIANGWEALLKSYETEVKGNAD